MKVVKITNGEVHLKDYCTRKLKKEINKTLFADVSANSDGKLEGISMGAMDAANDVALVGMTEKIIIDGQDKPVQVATFDAMDERDVSKVIEELNKIIKTEIPNS